MIYELVLRNFACSLEFVFSLLLLTPTVVSWNITLRTENCQVMVLAAAKFYFQQQLTAGAACSGASKTFALSD